MNAMDRVLQRCAVAAIHARQNAKSPWTTPFVPATFCDSHLRLSRIIALCSKSSVLFECGPEGRDVTLGCTLPIEVRVSAIDEDNLARCVAGAW